MWTVDGADTNPNEEATPKFKKIENVCLRKGKEKKKVLEQFL